MTNLICYVVYDLTKILSCENVSTRCETLGENLGPELLSDDV